MGINPEVVSTGLEYAVTPINPVDTRKVVKLIEHHCRGGQQKSQPYCNGQRYYCRFHVQVSFDTWFAVIRVYPDK